MGNRKFSKLLNTWNARKTVPLADLVSESSRSLAIDLSHVIYAVFHRSKFYDQKHSFMRYVRVQRQQHPQTVALIAIIMIDSLSEESSEGEKVPFAEAVSQQCKKDVDALRATTVHVVADGKESGAKLVSIKRDRHVSSSSVSTIHLLNHQIGRASCRERV